MNFGIYKQLSSVIGASDLSIIWRCLMTQWKFLRTTKINSELFVSFWNDFHMWTNIFVHEIESKTKWRPL